MHLSIFNSNLYKVISFLMCTLIFVLMCDNAIYYFIKYIHKNTFYGQTGGKINYAITKNYDNLFMGSSKVYHNIDTKKIENYFNLGHDGQRIATDLGILDILIKSKKKPKNIILHTDPNSFFTDTARIAGYDAFDISMVSMFYNQSNEIKNIINENSSNNILYKIFKSYSYNGKVLSIFKNYIKTKIDKNKFYNGFSPLIYSEDKKDIFKKSLDKLRKKKKNIQVCNPDVYAISLLKKVIYICQSNDINLICFNAPEYIQNNDCISELEEFLTSRNIDFFNYSNIANTESRFKDIQLWYDNAHLNNIGADIFTEILLKDINKVKN